MVAQRGAVVVGASAGVGRALAHTLAARGYDVVLAARDARDLDALASDVRLRYGVRVHVLPVDLTAPDESLREWLDRCEAAMPDPDVVLFPVGLADDTDDGLTSWDTTTTVLATNASAVIRLAGAFLRGFEARGSGTIVVFSSIAADAPRARNVAYAAAKNALESWARSMQHRLGATAVSVQVYVLGYVDTPSARAHGMRLPAVAPERVAGFVVDGLSLRRRVAYYPRSWRVLTAGLRALPFDVYRRIRL